MASVQYNIVEQGKLKEDENGYKLTAVARCFDFNATSADDAQVEAMDAVPTRNTFHSSIPGLLVQQRRILKIDPGLIMIGLDYASPQGDDKDLEPDGDARLEIGGSLARTEVNEDRDGNPLLISFTKNGKTVVPEKLVKVESDIAIPMLRFVRLETITADGATDVSKQYSNRLNADNFYGVSPNELFMQPVRSLPFGSASDGSSVRKMIYEMHYQELPNAWKAKVVAEDENGNVPNGVTQGNGIEFYDHRKEVNFGPLNLSVA